MGWEEILAILAILFSGAGVTFGPKLIKWVRRRRKRYITSQIDDEFLLTLKRPDRGRKSIKIYVLPNPERDRQIDLTWDTFGRGIENLKGQIRGCGYTLSPDVFFGVNEAGLVIVTYLRGLIYRDRKLGYIQTGRTAEGIDILPNSFFPKLGEKPIILLADIELKSGNSLKTVFQKLREEYTNPAIYLAIFGATTERPDLKIEDLDELVAAGNLSGLGIRDYFIAATIHHPGIEPPLGLK